MEASLCLLVLVVSLGIQTSQGALWSLAIYIDDKVNSESGDILWMDVRGRVDSMSGITLGNDFANGGTRAMQIDANFGEIDSIRLYQTGTDGLRVRKVVMEDENGRSYTISCECWIQTDQPAPDSKPSWDLMPNIQVWFGHVYIDTMDYSQSGDTLYMDAHGTVGELDKIRIGNNFEKGETRQFRVYARLGKINFIRLYQAGSDGMRVRKVVMEDENGRSYTFSCECWIQTDQPAPDSKPSWNLTSQNCYWDDPIHSCVDVVRVSCQIGKCDKCTDSAYPYEGVCRDISTGTIPPSTSTTTSHATVTAVPVPSTTLATRADIECDNNQIAFHVPLGLLPAGQHVTWNDPACVVADNGTHWSGSLDLGDCGTYVVFNTTHVTFENELVSHAGQINVTSGLHNEIDFGTGTNSVVVVQCVYPRREQVSMAFRPVQGQVRFFEKSMGHMDVHMRQARDASFDETYVSQTDPRTVHLNDEIFVKLTTDQGNRTKVAINVDRCLATPSPSPLDTDFQELTTDGCPAIPSVTMYSSPTYEVHLSFRAFQFSSHPGAAVYVHCEVYVCPLSNPHCVTGCNNNAVARSRRAAEGRIKTHLVSTGPFPWVEDKDQGTEGGLSTVLLPVIGLCACLAFATCTTVFGFMAWRWGRRLTSKETVN